MGKVYQRRDSSFLWIVYRDAAGKRHWQATECRVGEEERAQKVLEAIERQVAAETRVAVAPGALTVKAYGERWLQGRAGQGVVTHEDEARRLRLHAWPLLGDVLLKELRPHHVRDMVRALRSKKSARGTLLAPRTVRHVFGTLRTLMRDAEVDELIASNPCKLKRGELPPKVDADREWRGSAVFTRAEAEALISDERVPEDRRMWNALLFLAGLRFGEAAALRWRHYDAAVEPLGRLTIANSWNADAGAEGSTKTEVARHVPVHPTLARALAAWKLGGWERYFGRPPGPDDLISPNRQGNHRNPRRALIFFHADCDALGFRRRRQHDSRRSFVTLARADGARKDLIDLVTHAPSAEMVDVYSSFDWPTLCAEVAKLKLELRTGQLVAMPRAVGAADPVTACDGAPQETKKPRSPEGLRGFFSARSRGLEPLTSAVTGRRSNQLN